MGGYIMQISAKAISEYQKNGVVSLKNLKSANYCLYRLYLKHKVKFDELLLLDYKVCILNDLKPITNPESMRLYLTYYYGKKIHIPDLKKERLIYNNLCNICGGIEYFKSLGFKFTYKDIGKYIPVLDNMVDKNGYLLPPRKEYHFKMYMTLYYCARRRNMTYVEYLQYLGYKIKDRKEWKVGKGRVCYRDSSGNIVEKHV